MFSTKKDYMLCFQQLIFAHFPELFYAYFGNKLH